ncbi:type II toxin-antitoxin system HicB family antitoxin [Picosynechococcus sp. PCC 8807]|uniref:type II toxin-antitoxin system HicB family antitoxin n=1 Tax=Picosynechococcus sp. PCC 8807 TaxID=195248 RepID=UPI0008105C1A|nr:type II toxin-antitoxin system HicB family antitoxin [Picosynechococcus sp. PCC 8807]ANV90560.1 DNA repair protein [Picosynechococcus sp. PCC 8807]
MNMMILDGYRAKIEYDPELDLFRGEILGLNGGADFYGRNPEELRQEFKNSLAVFLEVCKEKGISPIKEYSGRFNLRVSPELHREIAILTASKNTSINRWITEVLQEAVQSTDYAQ